MGRILWAFLLVVPSVMAEIHTWTDDQGVTHYSDEVPANRKATSVELGEPLVIDTSNIIPSAEKTRRHRVSVEPDGRERQVSPESGEAQTSRQARRDKQVRCRELKDKIERIDKRLRAGYREPTGNRLREKRRRLRSERVDLCWR